jgi:Domain of unknown function (DUF4126)
VPLLNADRDLNLSNLRTQTAFLDLRTRLMDIVEISQSPLAQFALAGGLAWASGIRLYAVCLLLGALAHFKLLALPGQLGMLAHPYVLGASGVMCVAEFFADKVPAFDSLWDAVHTFIRGPGGALLAGLAVSNGVDNQVTAVIAGLLGGTLATGVHLTKAGTRAVINHSPEPFSNWAASITEDVGVLGIMWLAWQHPLIFCGLLIAFIALMVWLLPKLWRFIRGIMRRLGGSAKVEAA